MAELTTLARPYAKAAFEHAQAHQQLAFDARVSVHCWGGVLLRTMHVLALFYHPMASNHPGIIRVMQPYNSPAALSFA